MSKLARGIVHGAIYAAVFCIVVMMLTPAINRVLGIILIAGVVFAFAFGIGINLRSTSVVCGHCGRSYPATSAASKCPDCGWSKKTGTLS